MIYFTNYKGGRLPEDINKVANERYDPEYSERKSDKNNELNIVFGFDWHKTLEGCDIWNEVEECNYNPFYNFHNKTENKNYK